MTHDDLVEVVHQRPRCVPVRPNHQASCSLLHVYMVIMMVIAVDNYEKMQKNAFKFIKASLIGCSNSRSCPTDDHPPYSCPTSFIGFWRLSFQSQLFCSNPKLIIWLGLLCIQSTSQSSSLSASHSLCLWLLHFFAFNIAVKSFQCHIYSSGW